MAQLRQWAVPSQAASMRLRRKAVLSIADRTDTERATAGHAGASARCVGQARKSPPAVMTGGPASDAIGRVSVERGALAGQFHGVPVTTRCDSYLPPSAGSGSISQAPDSPSDFAAATPLPVTVKCRIGVDEQDPEQALDALADAVLKAGAAGLIVHARKAWLKGLSPRENRDVPPLDYERVRRLKARLPHVPVVLNGGLANVRAGLAELGTLDGMMLGRAAYQDPELLFEVDPLLYGEPAPLADSFAVVEAFEPYVAAHVEAGGRLSDITRHMLGLFGGRRGSRIYRRRLSTEAIRPGAGLDVLRGAVDEVRRRAAGSRAA